MDIKDPKFQKDEENIVLGKVYPNPNALPARMEKLRRCPVCHWPDTDMEHRLQCYRALGEHNRTVGTDKAPAGYKAWFDKKNQPVGTPQVKEACHCTGCQTGEEPCNTECAELDGCEGCKQVDLCNYSILGRSAAEVASAPAKDPKPTDPVILPREFCVSARGDGFVLRDLGDSQGPFLYFTRKIDLFRHLKKVL